MVKRITLILSAVLILFSLTVFMIAPASAAVRRCDARYEWQTTGGSIGPIRFGEFTAKGECGSTAPNKCRDRARKAAKSCIKQQWDNRWNYYQQNPDIIPQRCSEANNIENYDLTTVCVKRQGGNPQGICFNVIDSSVAAPPLILARRGDIKSALETRVCCKFEQGRYEFPNNQDVHVRLSARTLSSSGNNRCSHNEVLSSDYKIDCTRVRRNVCQF